MILSQRPTKFATISEEVRHSIGTVLDQYMVKKIISEGNHRALVGGQVLRGISDAFVDALASIEVIERMHHDPAGKDKILEDKDCHLALQIHEELNVVVRKFFDDLAEELR